MKKLLLIATLVMVLASAAIGATEQTVHQYGYMKVLVIEWTAEADGSFTAAETNAINGTVGWVETSPGTTAPTSLYDITLTTTDSYDIMGGKLGDRSSTVTEAVAPYDSVNEIYLTYPVRGPLTVNITNNSVNSATGTITIYYWTY